MKRTTFTIVMLILVIGVLFLQILGWLEPIYENLPAKKIITHAATFKEVRNSDVQKDVLTSMTSRSIKIPPISTTSFYTDTTTARMTMSTSVLYKERTEVTSQSNQPRKPKEVTHIAFLKVHKAASSTMQAIMQRFGLRRNLSFVIADSSHYISKQRTFFSDIWPPLPKVSNVKGQMSVNSDDADKHDILCNHMVFNQKKTSKLLHEDSKYIAIVREPMDLFMSAAFYYKFVWNFPYLERLSNDTFITDLIRNPNQTEATTMAESMTYNSMAYDFGLDFGTLKDARKISEKKISQFLNKTANTFHLVLLVEKFDESLVLMKRYLNWSLDDIIYIKTNTYLSKLKTSTLKGVNVTANDTKLFRKRNKFDYALYEFFKERLEKQISKESAFRNEVEHFKNIQRSVQTFCDKEKLRQKNEKANLSVAVRTDKNNSAKNSVLFTSVNGSKVRENNIEGKQNTSVQERIKDLQTKISKSESPNTSRKNFNVKKESRVKNNPSRNNGVIGQNFSKSGEKKVEGVTKDPNKRLQYIIHSTIQGKRLAKSQEEEIRGLAIKPDRLKYINKWTLEKLARVLSLLFDDKKTSLNIKSKLKVSKSKWNEEFVFAASDCQLLTMDELARYNVVKEKHLKHLVRRKFGDNFNVLDALKYIFTFY